MYLYRITFFNEQPQRILHQTSILVKPSERLPSLNPITFHILPVCCIRQSLNTPGRVVQAVEVRPVSDLQLSFFVIGLQLLVVFMFELGMIFALLDRSLLVFINISSPDI